MDTEMLLNEVAQRMDAMIIVTAAEGLGVQFLGAHINDVVIGRLKDVAEKNRINLAGEGGEYETLTLDAPFYSRPITYTSSEIQSSPDRHEMVLGGFA
jgi:diphthamide synthase (EF-2-diphthine--ammonia ligase)